MSQASKRELVDRLRDRYLRGNRSEKSRILDEFVAVTGMHRKHAIRLMRQGYQRERERRGRKREYTGAAVSGLMAVWRVSGCICGKRLAPFLPELVASLERHGELSLDQETRGLLLQMSAATIDRKLQPFRLQQGRGLSTTKPGTLLKQSIPVRTFADWDDAQAGFVEMDLVAHCGDSVAGQYLNTLTATDVTTAWTECLVLRQRSQLTVSAAMDQLRRRLPFPLLGADCDNDGAFINGTLLRYFEQAQITFTRSRPYKKNDQAFVEQKNGAVVRQLIGYRRYTSSDAADLLEAIYQDLHSYLNFFQPVLKLTHKERRGARVFKKYDQAKTPHQRAMLSPDLSPVSKIRLQQAYRKANPAELRRRIDANIGRLRQLAE
jgi:hypothetical protein